MIADELKSQIDELSKEQRHELSACLTKLELENDPDYWQTIRERSSDPLPAQVLSNPREK